jgi:uncharacterized cupredoxin-like copper-binding protein
MKSALRRRLGVTGLLLASCMLLVAFWSSSSSAKQAHASSSVHVVDITANPYGALKYTTTKATTTAGKVEISFTNHAPIQHDVVLSTKSGTVLGKTPIFTGGTKTFTVTLKAGTYIWYCSVPGHRAAGMLGTLTVTS